MRRLDDWLASYLEYTSGQESPEVIHLWSAITVIAGALRRRVWLDRGMYKIWPNLYVVIVADSAKLRKSVATGIAFAILREAVPDLAYIEDRVTPEGLVRHVNRISTVGQTQVSVDSSLFIYEDEIESLFGFDVPTSRRMATLLTRTYSCPDTYQHTTVTGGHVEIRNPAFTILAATAPEGLDVIPKESTGGLLGRLVIVVADSRRPAKPWPTPGPEDLRLKLVNDLAWISRLKGEARLSQEARDHFDQWYLTVYGKHSFPTRALEAFHERIHDTAIKVAVILSVARRDDLVVRMDEMSRAISLVEGVMEALGGKPQWFSADEIGRFASRVTELLRRRGPLTRGAVMRHFGLSAAQMDAIERTLEDQDEILITISGRAKLYTPTSRR